MTRPVIAPKNSYSKQAWAFTKNEIVSVFLWASFGAVCAGILRLLCSDHAFDATLAAKYLPPSKSFDDTARYIPYALTVAATVAVIVLIRLPTIVWRGCRSWWLGVTSGLRFLPFVLTLAVLSSSRFRGWHRALIYSALMVASFIAGAILHCLANKRSRHVPNEKDIKVSVETKNVVRTQISDSDDPIETWAEDTLDRAALVDSLTVKVLISKAPVIALFGEFGSGKSSILNLLREHLSGKAIVVSFSTWLPGSPETLTSYLLSDIANECQKEYVVPGLRKSASRLANALAQSVPFLKGYSQLFPAPTQKDDIESLRQALARLPKRVVVLLDELDRMERDELLPLLKVVRGIASLPNLTFVCAVEPETLKEKVLPEKTSDEQNLYIEKFFPFSVPVPKIDVQLLQTAGIERLIGSLKRRSWFENEAEVNEFRTQLEGVWQRRIAPFCKNLRGVGLLANDVGIAAAPLRREVDPIDLTFIELLRRFKPDVYDIVSRNSISLTGGDSWLRGGDYHGSEELKRLKQRMMDDLQTACPSDAQSESVKGILGEMFPSFAKAEKLVWEQRPKRKEGDESDKRISNSGMFPAYFRYELPSAIFSSVELEKFIQLSTDEPDEAARKRHFIDELNSMEKGSLKRSDFLTKISDAINTIPIDIGRDWVAGAMEEAKGLTYDTMTAFGEAGDAIRMVIRIAQRLPKSDRAPFLAKCMADASDDTMAFRILTRLAGQQKELDLQVPYAELYPIFVARMRGQYGRQVDAATVDLSTSDAYSFNLWGAQDLSHYGVVPDPEDRAIQYDFGSGISETVGRAS